MTREYKRKRTNTFRWWLSQQTGRTDGVGDLAREAAADRGRWHGTTADSLARHYRASLNPTRATFSALANAEREHRRLELPVPAERSS